MIIIIKHPGELMKKRSHVKKTDLYIPSDGDLWHVPSNPRKKPVLKGKRSKIFFRNTLRYCKSCKTQWERSTCGSQIHYSHLPTYGLKRVICDNCKNK